jgi:hypothetical protein
MIPELTVIVKDAEKRLTKKYLMYQPFACTIEDPEIKRCIEETLEEFEGKPDSIKLRITVEIE